MERQRGMGVLGSIGGTRRIEGSGWSGATMMTMTRLLWMSGRARWMTTTTSLSPRPSVSVRVPPTKKPRVLVVGAGWGGFQFVHSLDRTKFDVTCISPRNHFLFTPLLASTSVGTLEFRTIIEPVRTLPNLHYYQAEIQSVDVQQRTVFCTDAFYPQLSFELPFDYLVLAFGAQSNTFNTPGTDKYAFQLKQLSDARAIRSRLIENFEKASSLVLTNAERRKFSTFVVVGGGPTSVEFAGELWDFIHEDVRKWFPDVQPSIVLIESGDHLLHSFDESLSQYVHHRFHQRKDIQVLTNSRVKEVTEDAVVLQDGRVIPTGLVVWSTGLMPNPLAHKLPFVKEPRSGRLLITNHLQVLAPPGTAAATSTSGGTPPAAAPPSTSGGAPAATAATASTPLTLPGSPVPYIFALGDCAKPVDAALPATAQVANQEALYLARQFDHFLRDNDATTFAARSPPFVWHNMGMLAYIGGWRALTQVGTVKAGGFASWLFWRSAYITQLMSWKNKILVLMHWFKAWVFGRDISRF